MEIIVKTTTILRYILEETKLNLKKDKPMKEKMETKIWWWWISPEKATLT